MSHIYDRLEHAQAENQELAEENERLKDEIVELKSNYAVSRELDRRIAETEKESLRKRVAELEQQLAEVEGYPGIAADMIHLQKAVDDAYGVAFDSPELNMCNYDHDQVAQLNAAMCEVCSVLEGAATRKEGE